VALGIAACRFPAAEGSRVSPSLAVKLGLPDPELPSPFRGRGPRSGARFPQALCTFRNATMLPAAAKQPTCGVYHLTLPIILVPVSFDSWLPAFLRRTYPTFSCVRARTLCPVQPKNPRQRMERPDDLYR
jgi:hypothetical protein